MTSPTSYYFFNLFGLIVASERQFDELIKLPPQDEVDVFIHFDTVNIPDGVDDIGDDKQLLQRVSEDFYFLKLGGYAMFEVVQSNCTNIKIDVIDPEKYSIIKSWLFGSIFTAVLHMNDRFALHASAVQTPDGVVLFCGRSGIGKSTIATRLNTHGLDIVSDDKSVLTLGQDDQIYIEPSIQITRLWDDSLEKLEDDSFLENPESVSLSDDKFQFLIKEDKRILKPLIVKAVYIIRQIREEGQLSVNHLSGNKKHHLLMQQVHRKHFVKKLNKEKEHWEFLNKITTRIPVSVLRRPMNTSHEDFTEFVKAEIT